MDIAATSMSLASLKIGLEVGASVSKKVMESAEVNAEAITEMLEAIDQMAPSESVNLIDVRA
ncbi:YjfB family protein [Lachnospiraceae bacterium 50-23]|nr:putative motility protein [Dorea sp.]